jgi:hypothetical protein
MKRRLTRREAALVRESARRAVAHFRATHRIVLTWAGVTVCDLTHEQAQFHSLTAGVVSDPGQTVIPLFTVIK